MFEEICSNLQTTINMEATLEPNTRKKLPNDRKMTGRFEFEGALYLILRNCFRNKWH